MTKVDYEHKLFMQQVKWQHAVLSADWELIELIEKENRETRIEFEKVKRAIVEKENQARRELIEMKKALRNNPESFGMADTI